MTNKLALTAMTAALVLALAGCAEEKGPMEKMGESMDNAAESVQKSADDAADKIKDAVEE